jgi:uncharacterized protein (DUF2236 family)
MGLVQLGRARLAMALPRHRRLLRSTKDRQLDDLFEAYARASTALDTLMRELPRPEIEIVQYHQRCLDLQAEVVTLLAQHQSVSGEPKV